MTSSPVKLELGLVKGGKMFCLATEIQAVEHMAEGSSRVTVRRHRINTVEAYDCACDAEWLAEVVSAANTRLEAFLGDMQRSGWQPGAGLSNVKGER